MAIQLNYTDERTVNYPASYWRITRNYSNKNKRTWTFTLSGFKDSATSTSAKTNAAIESIGEKVVVVKNAAFDTAAAAEVAKTKNSYEIGYEAALANAAFTGGTSV